jgi:hypothetical protein
MQLEAIKLSKEDGGEDKKKLQVAQEQREFNAHEETTAFEEYSHGPKDIEDNNEQVYSNVMNQQETELDIEIDGLWKLMMKKVIRWNYPRMKKIVNHKLQLAKKDYIIKVIGKKQSKTWDPRRLQAITI